MLSFNWKSGYSVGIKQLDAQHRALMGSLNELHDVMMGGNLNDAAAPLIRKLVLLAGQHFSTEEGLMESTAFPGFAEHRARHQELTRKVAEFIARHEDDDKVVYSQFMYFVRDWLSKHMLHEDHGYAPWLAEHGIR
jgi:hemerythrin